MNCLILFCGILTLVSAGRKQWSYDDSLRSWSYSPRSVPKVSWDYHKDDGDSSWRLIYPSDHGHKPKPTTTTTTTTTTTPPPTTTTEKPAKEDVWTYTGMEDPMTWPCLYRGCRGSNQSPINIDTEILVVNRSLTPIYISNLDAPLENLTIENTGYDLLIRIPSSANITATAAWLNGSYRLNAIYFYWSNTSRRGSQHTVDSKYFPMEAVLLFLKSEYKSLVDKPDAVLAMSVLFKIKPYDNTHLNPIFDSLGSVIYPGVGKMTSTFRLRGLLPYDITSFVRYKGSAHAPPCYEGWTWIVFHHANSVSENQMKRLRQLRSSPKDAPVETFITNNARPIQPLNDRIIETTPAPLPVHHHKIYHHLHHHQKHYAPTYDWK